MSSNEKKFRISFNAPAVLVFAGICVIAQLLNKLTNGASNSAVFSVYRSSLANPLTYLRCVCHVFGHAGWDHLIGNMMYLLILGPMIEEKYILVALLYIGQQIYQGLFRKDNISQMAHIVGGIVGSVLGFALNRMKNKSRY